MASEKAVVSVEVVVSVKVAGRMVGAFAAARLHEAVVDVEAVWRAPNGLF